MVEKYASEEARAVHRNGEALAALVAALDGRLSQPLDVQVLTPHPAGDPSKGAL